MIKNVFRPNEEYCKNCIEYGPIDALKALGLFALVFLTFVIMGALSKFTNLDVSVIETFVNMLLVLLTFAFAKSEGRGWKSLGLEGGKLGLSVALGGILATLLFIGNFLIDVINGMSPVSVGKAMILALYFFTVGLSEEVIFRGYIGTRICGFVKYKTLAVIVTGILFVFIHFPYRMIAYGWSMTNFIEQVPWIINLFVTHVILNLIYIMTNSLWGAVLPHWISDLAYRLVER